MLHQHVERNDPAISIHALLAESDSRLSYVFFGKNISIHALLAESDRRRWRASRSVGDFYPRSPCGERLQTQYALNLLSVFLSTLSLRRATRKWFRARRCSANFYPRSPCGERRRQADRVQHHRDFYPRSPCGERLGTGCDLVQGFLISIHALLAESDADRVQGLLEVRISIHALLAESDCHDGLVGVALAISIHALLAESDGRSAPRAVRLHISIHALLAESDTCPTLTLQSLAVFLSTLSLRRATQYSSIR